MTLYTFQPSIATTRGKMQTISNILGGFRVPLTGQSYPLLLGVPDSDFLYCTNYLCLFLARKKRLHTVGAFVAGFVGLIRETLSVSSVKEFTWNSFSCCFCQFTRTALLSCNWHTINHTYLQRTTWWDDSHHEAITIIEIMDIFIAPKISLYPLGHPPSPLPLPPQTLTCFLSSHTGLHLVQVYINEEYSTSTLWSRFFTQHAYTEIYLCDSRYRELLPFYCAENFLVGVN